MVSTTHKPLTPQFTIQTQTISSENQSKAQQILEERNSPMMQMDLMRVPVQLLVHSIESGKKLVANSK